MIEAMIQGALHRAPQNRTSRNSNQRQVTFAMPPELLTKVDDVARKLSLTRSVESEGKIN